MSIRNNHSNPEEIITLFEKEMPDACHEALLYINRYATQHKDKLAAMKLSWEWNDTQQTQNQGTILSSIRSKEEIATDFIELILSVKETYSNNPNSASLELTKSKVKEQFLQLKETKNKVVYQSSGISKTYGKSGFTLQPIDVCLKQGEITGVVGENGNGKSTLIKLIAGEEYPNEGSSDYPLLNTKSWLTTKQDIAYIQQRLNRWNGKVKDYLHFTAAIKGLKGKENEQEVEYIIHRLGLTRFENHKWEELSGGYQMRFELARMLVWKPKLLILDEPLAHLDINAQATFLSDLRQLSSSIKHPISVIITSQHLYEIENISDNLIFLRQGQCIYNGPTKEFGNNRSLNSFEVTTNRTLAQLKQLLTTHNINELDDKGNTIIISTPLDINSDKMIRILLDNGVKINYFRDISHSTRKLF